MTDANKEWMMRGKIGCTFAALFARNPAAVNWVTMQSPSTFSIPEDAAILSLQFQGSDRQQVFEWALRNGFYTEDLGDGCIGLRYNIGGMIAWVQYFGPDSHVPTRQAPIPELCMAVRLPAKKYAKVGFKGVLHLAHACVKSLTDRAADILWDTSFKNTERRLGHKPGLKEAAKTTYCHE